jgi:hypothetical protein
MSCEWGRTDCSNAGNRCFTCVAEDLHYSSNAKKAPQPIAKVRSTPSSKRKGSTFEDRNHVRNTDLISGVTTRMTPNSGAGSVKGDQEIQGIINIMEELKEENKILAKGDKSFSIKKSWLEKLEKEGREAGKEFWYIKFCYGTHDTDTYVVMSEDMCMSMVQTMVEDRKTKKKIELESVVNENRRRLLEAENVKLYAEIELLKSQIKLESFTNGE